MSEGRIEVLVELYDHPSQWWPVRVSASPSGRHFPIVYERLPEVDYEEESPSQARFDPAGALAKDIPHGAVGRLWDVGEQCWRPWRHAGDSNAHAHTAGTISSGIGRADGLSQPCAPEAVPASAHSHKRAPPASHKARRKAQRGERMRHERLEPAAPETERL